MIPGSGVGVGVGVGEMDISADNTVLSDGACGVYCADADV